MILNINMMIPSRLNLLKANFKNNLFYDVLNIYIFALLIQVSKKFNNNNFSFLMN